MILKKVKRRKRNKEKKKGLDFQFNLKSFEFDSSDIRVYFQMIRMFFTNQY